MAGSAGFCPSAAMTKDDSIPFTLAGDVRDWNPKRRVIGIGEARLGVSPEVVVDALLIGQLVTVSGYRSKFSGGPWIVTEIRPQSASV
jgi:hypothetical protein